MKNGRASERERGETGKSVYTFLIIFCYCYLCCRHGKIEYCVFIPPHFFVSSNPSLSERSEWVKDPCITLMLNVPCIPLHMVVAKPLHSTTSPNIRGKYKYINSYDENETKPFSDCIFSTLLLLLLLLLLLSFCFL
jgi:hypothetical protein